MSELIKPHVLTEAEALKRIRDAIDSMDLDDLACLVSDVCDTDGPVVVVHDGCEATTAEELGADDTIPVSAVYENGENVGDLAEDGTIYGDDAEDDADEAKNQSDKSFGGMDDE